MALEAVVDSLEGIPEALHEHYTKDGDKYNLRVNGYEGDAGLKAVLEDKKADVTKLRARLREFEGIDPAEVAELRELRDTYEDKVAAAGKWEDQKARLEQKHAKAIEAMQAETDALSGDLSKTLSENAARSVFADEGAISDALLPHVMKRTKIVVEDGKRRAVATGLDGETETDIKGLVGEMKASGKFDWGFAPTGNSGSGGPAGSGGGSAAGQVRSRADLKTTAEKSRFIAEHGQAKYLALPAETTT